MQLDSETVSLVRRMVLCQTPEMPAIKSIVMAGVENKATRRLRFIEELKKRGMERSTPTVSVIGNGNAVAQGAGAKAVVVKGEPGELPQCSKCPIKKQLAKIERAMSGK